MKLYITKIGLYWALIIISYIVLKFFLSLILLFLLIELLYIQLNLKIENLWIL